MVIEDKKVEEFINHIRKFKSKIFFYSKTFNKLKVKPNMMIYCDPPYSNTEAGYNAYWNKGDDDILYDFLINADKKGASWVLSGSLKHGDKESPLLIKMLENFKHVKIDYNYRKVSKKTKKTEEIIIKNF